MRYVYGVLFAFVLMGCGNSSEPKVEQSITKKEENSTRTHIRVLAEDEGSKIPEHLLKLPIEID